ncbi:helix-turn-helix domain-containing protein [Chloroflexota bacterium]
MSRRRRKNPIWLYSVSEISEAFGFHPNTIRLWIHRDSLRHYRKGRGGKIHIREDDLKDFFTKFYEP